MPMTPADRARQNEMADLEHALEAMVGPTGKHLVDRLSELQCDAQAAAEDRVLRVCGAVVLEWAVGLFEDMFARAREGDHIESGDARRFLFSELPQ